MPQPQVSMNNSRSNLMVRMLNQIERAANHIPHPFMLFVYLAVFVILVSWFLGNVLNIGFMDPASGKETHIQSLLSGQGLDYILTHMLTNFTGFAPLGYVVAIVLAIGLAEKVGLLETSIKKLVHHTPSYLITYSVIFIGIVGNIASDVSFVFIPPLAAMVFKKAGRHPLAGMIAGFSSVGAAYSANFLIANIDALLAGISTEVAKTVDPNAYVTPVDNWYFNIASLIVLTVAGVLVTEKIIEPKLGPYHGNDVDEEETEEVSPLESKALRNTGIAILIYLAVLALSLFIPHSPLRNENGGLVPSPFLEGIVPIIMFLFLVAGITYGITVKKIRKTEDVPRFMTEGIKELASFIVLIFAAAQFISYFEWTHLGAWVAVEGAQLLESIHFTGLGAIFGFLALNLVMGIFIISGSALWALTGTIFIPLFMQLNYDPAFVQAVYRIASSVTNSISPVNPFIVAVLGFMKRYDDKAGIGTLITLALPYSIVFLIFWVILLVIFVLFGIPFGPGVGIHLH